MDANLTSSGVANLLGISPQLAAKRMKEAGCFPHATPEQASALAMPVRQHISSRVVWEIWKASGHKTSVVAKHLGITDEAAAVRVSRAARLYKDKRK